MAIILPDSIKEFEFKEEGEEKVFYALRKLPDTCRVWYEVVLGVRSRKPDFMVLDPERGLLIIEVKDWGRATILGASEKEFKIKSKGNDHHFQKNPDRKCRVYIEEATEKLELEESLVGKYDKLSFPIEYCIIFPNLNESDFVEIGIGKYVDRNRVIFKHDFLNSDKFELVLFKNLPKLNKALSNEMMLSIRNAVREEATINAPGGKNGLLPGIIPEGKIEIADELTDDVFAIDIEQEKLAKDFGEGPRLMRGIAGTGKTLIYLMRAKLLASNAEAIGKPIKLLVLCWNISLANYMRQAFNSIKIPLISKAHTDINLDTGVPILHFMEFARQLSRKHAKQVGYFPRSTEDGFEERVSEILRKIKIQAEEKYDVVIIDEAQDFRDEWIKFVFDKLLKGGSPNKKNLLMAADDAQRVYKRSNFTWKSLGIPLVGGDRSTILRKIYRNSARVWGFAAFLLRDIADYYDKNPDLQFSPKRGVDPRLIDCKTPSQQINACIQEIKEIKKNGYSWRNVLIIYNRVRTSNGYPLIEVLIQRLAQEKIPYQWITENMESKNTFNWAEDSVKISTALSAKGLDAPKVIILSAESFQSDANEHDETKLMYVALTRAREELTIYHTGNKGLVPELQRSEEMYNKNRETLIKLEKRASEQII